MFVSLFVIFFIFIYLFRRLFGSGLWLCGAAKVTWSYVFRHGGCTVFKFFFFFFNIFFVLSVFHVWLIWIFCIDYCLRCLMFGCLFAHMRHVSCRLMAFLVPKGRVRFFWRGRMFELLWLGQTVWAMEAMRAMEAVWTFTKCVAKRWILWPWYRGNLCI